MCKSAPQSLQDPRFTLTPWEHESVIRLMEACDLEGIPYKSTFELAKYVLVSKSAASDSDKNADNKRLSDSLKRMRKNREWTKKHNLDDIDPVEALVQVERCAPGFFVNDYTKDREQGRIVLAHGPTKSKWWFESNENLATYFCAEMCRHDLAAADMEEARRGITTVSKFGEESIPLKEYFHHTKCFLRCGKDMVQPMHSHRMKKIYLQISPIASRFVNIALAVLPKKIASRVTCMHKVEELEKYLDIDPKGPKKTIKDWYMERSAVYSETLQKLQL